MSEEVQGIAIVGLAGRFPGAQNVAEFWRNLVAGRETISQLTDEQLAAAGFDAKALRADPNFVAARGVLDRPEWFDAAFFGITPKEAEVMDPQQRVFLEECWTALEDAGIDPARPPGAIGVFAGMSNNTYWRENAGTRPDLIESVGWLTAMMGNEKDYLATRVAYKFDLRGPAISLYTACSTSLVAVCQACTSLLNFHCDAALAGGISITFPQERGYETQEGGITSPDGHCRTFDTRSAGTVFSHGVGVVVLKRLADALDAGDQIYAVIKGHALNNDGAQKVSFTAPSVDGHTEVIAMAQALADFPPESISYVEAHGTATPLGDPIEIAGLTQAFRAGSDRRAFCAIGSVKTNIGHLDAAAGVAGLIKTALALRHRQIPASLHFTSPNPQLELESSPFFVQTALSDWPEGSTPRRAGVSSFGVGGTNAHVVLEEAPSILVPPATANPEDPQLIVLSARSLRALEDATDHLVRYLRTHEEACLGDIAAILQQGRHTFGFRRFVVAKTIAEAARLLRRRDRRHVWTTTPKGGSPEFGTAAKDFLTLLGRRWLGGEVIDWSTLHVGRARRKISLPTYPFERHRYWAEPHQTPIPIVAPLPSVPDEVPKEPGDLFAQLKTELTTLSGLDVGGASAETTLVDLGFDSLFLTQVAIALQKKFGVRLRFRQFLDELATLGALTEYLRVHGQSSTQAVPAAAAPKIVPAPAATPAPARLLAHGPFRKIDTSAAAEFTGTQQQHVDDLIARYTARTAGSKRFTAENRARFADPRAVSGFRRTWKEMVYPLVADRSLGSKLWDIDGHEYTDITLGFGQILLGHRPSFLVEAVERQLHSGIEIGPTSPLTADVVNLMCEFTGMARVGFCNTGSEAVMAAIRVSRTVSGRDKIVMFAGAYHGIFDEVLIRPAGLDGAAAAIAPGIPATGISNVLVLDYGEESALELIRRHAHEIAAVLVEPVQSRRPGLQPREFLHALRKVTAEHEIALVFDEVVTGFRCHPGGAQAWFGIRADLATYGKVLGGGMPIGIVAGSPHYMDALDGGAWNFGDDSFPEVGVTFFAGTFVRHPLALAAAKAVLTHLKQAGPTLQEKLNTTAEIFVGGLNDYLAERGTPLRWSRFSSMYHLILPPELKYAGLLFTHLRLRGIHAWEGRPCFLSTAHTAEDLARVGQAFRESVDALCSVGLLGDANSGISIPANFSETEFPLTEAQQELLLVDRIGGDATSAFNESITIRFRGALDRPKLSGALQNLVDRHEALRTTFAANGRTQHVAPSLPITISDEDWSTKTADEQAAALTARIERETTTPFDLARGPLLRAILVKLAPDRFDLILTVHHIVCDGWSFGTLANELAALYSGGELPAATPFRTYANWLSTRMRAPEFAATERYWLDRFASRPPALDLPTDAPRPAIRTYRADRCITTLPKPLVASLQKISSQQRCTLFTTMLGAFYVLLHRLSGQDDLVVGIAAAGQAAMGRDALVGHCLNFLPIRAACENARPFTDFLGTLKTDVLDAFDHQDFTLGALLQKLALPRDPSRMPLLGVTFNIDRAATSLRFAGVEAEFDINRKSRLGFELSFNLLETDTGWQLYCAFNRDLFVPATISRWLGHFETILNGIAADPTKTLGDLPLLTTAEEHQLTREWAQRRPVEYPERTLHQLFAEQAARTPDAVAVRCEDQQLTYAELDRKAAGLAHHLHQLGVGPETIVGLCLDRSLDLVVGVLAILKAGAAYLPIDLSYPPERLAFMLEDAQAPVVLTHTSLSARLPEHGAKVVTIDTFTPEGEYHDSAASADALAYVIFTSGSTGKPKGCCITHRNVVRLMAATHPWFGFDAKDTWTLFHSIAFDFSVWELWGPLLYGGRLVVVPHAVSRSPEAFHELLAREKVTVLNQTPSAFRQLIAADASQPKLEKLRLVIFGGEALEMQSLRPWFDRYGDAQPQLVNMYGITETTVHVTYRPLKLSDVQGGSVIGEAIPDLEVFVLDQALKPVPIGVPGEMFVGGAGLARGYLRRPELTAQRFIEHPWRSGERLYRTGDLARFLPDRDIEYLGRIDQQVKIRGFRIELGEIESVLLKHEAIREAVVIARDQRLLAYLVPKIPGVLPAANELRTHLKAALPDYMVPAAFVPLERVPLTNNGKTDVRALPEPAAETGGDRPVGRAETTLHLELIELWETLLKRKPIGIHDDFFELGGHSLLAAQMLTTLEQRHGRRVPFAVLFEQATIAHLSAWLVGEERRLSIETPIVPIQTQGNKTPLFFLHGDFSGGGFFCRHLARYIGSDRPFYAIHPHGLHGELPPTTIEAMAAERLEAVRRIQPYGPYLLGGFCNGAIVAFEMARQLESMGESVPAIIMFGADGSNFRYRHVDALARSLSSLFQDSEANRAERFLRWRAQARKVEDWGRSQLLRFRAATRDAGHIPRRAAELLRKWTGTNGNGNTPTLELGNGCAALEDATPKVERAYITGLTAYVPGSVASRLILLWPEEDPAPGGKYPAYGWESVSTDSRVITVPGEHHSAIALEQNLRVVADHVRKELDAVDPEPVEDEVP